MKIKKITVVGLGYVGLPLACALSKNYPVVGFDISERRITELRRGYDATGEVDTAALGSDNISFSDDPATMAGSDCFLITVPTPVDDGNRPDLGYVRSACKTVGAVLQKGSVVVLESTVYPGVTEDVCGPALEVASGLICGEDFFVGYSPERINPGDKTHTIDKLTKVVSGQTSETLDALMEIYGSVGPTYAAPDIKTAEAAKVIENAQRDINIAFVNELAIIFNRLGVDTTAVLEAAGTKWNFLPFRPGLVGGHCISVDPYYLTYASERAGYHPQVILAGRKINDDMGRFVGAEVAKLIISRNLPKRILALGITFKENVPDIRNSQSVAVTRELESFGFEVDIHDPMADPDETFHEYGVKLCEPSGEYGAIVLTVPHELYAEWDGPKIESFLVSGGVVADVKGLFADKTFSPETVVWAL